MAKIKNVIRGDTCNIQVTITNPTTGAVMDLSGYTAFLTVKPSVNNTSNGNDDATTAVVQMSQFPIPDAANGIVEFSIPPATTGAITPGTYFYDVQIKDNSGNIFSSVPDKFIVLGDVGRRTT